MADYNKMKIKVAGKVVTLSNIETLMVERNFSIADYQSAIKQMNLLLCRLGGGIITNQEDLYVQVEINTLKDLQIAFTLIQSKVLELGHEWQSDELTQKSIMHIWNYCENGKNPIRIYFPTMHNTWGWDIHEYNNHPNLKTVPLQSLIGK